MLRARLPRRRPGRRPGAAGTEDAARRAELRVRLRRARDSRSGPALDRRAVRGDVQRPRTRRGRLPRQHRLLRHPEHQPVRARKRRAPVGRRRSQLGGRRAGLDPQRAQRHRLPRPLATCTASAALARPSAMPWETVLPERRAMRHAGYCRPGRRPLGASRHVRPVPSPRQPGLPSRSGCAATAAPSAPLTTPASNRSPTGARHTTWMPRSCRWNNMAGTSMPYNPRAGGRQNRTGVTAAAGSSGTCSRGRHERSGQTAMSASRSTLEGQPPTGDPAPYPWRGIRPSPRVPVAVRGRVV